MTGRSLLPDLLERYVAAWHQETPVLQRLRAETATLPDAGMQIGADQAAFMALLVGIMDAKRCLEIGTFTGYSALAVAAALPPDGRLLACDVSEERTAIARRYWQEAGVAGHIELRLAPALETLTALLREGRGNSFDFIFIDADKMSYPDYYELSLQLARPGGVLLLDNMLWSGKVADSTVQDAETRVLRELNEKIRRDSRVEATLLTIGDGVLMVRRRMGSA